MWNWLKSLFRLKTKPVRSATANARRAILYTRPGCHLCEEALSSLSAEGFEVTLVNIDHDPQLSARFSREIPVVEISGQIRFRGRIDIRLLRRLKAN
jgi:glutaredoxin